MSTILAFLLVWVALVAPVQLSRLTPGAFVRIPLEGLALVVLALVLPTRPSRIVAATFGLALGALLLVKILDLGFFAVFDRPFDLLNDWAYLGPGIGVLGDSIGHGPAVATAVAAVVLAVAVLVLMPLCVVRLTRLVATHRRVSVRAVTAFGVVWILSAVFGLQFAPDARVASTSAADLAVAEVNQVRFDIHDRKTFGKLDHR